jgi:hypothetical protein
MIRLWCRAYTDSLSLESDYQPWVVAEFSGILCVDEVYQDQLAVLLAVDPAAPHGDRLVGYQLVHGAAQQADLTRFLERLRQAGIVPDEVITDASPLYPAVLRTVWPSAAHQLCLFHETRLVTDAVAQSRRSGQLSRKRRRSSGRWGDSAKKRRRFRREGMTRMIGSHGSRSCSACTSRATPSGRSPV